MIISPSTPPVYNHHFSYAAPPSMNPGSSWQLMFTCWRTAVFASIGAFRSIATTFIHSLGVSTVSGTAADYSAGACIAVFGPRQYVQQQLPS